ncbi:hypothetical protein ABEB36_000578 [Hypothenemus hampei]|uniref:Uncharacterized protein n=1 Tax=Hypothenemus hampei TaxID=57062 RepID=A0ABD1FBT0_HYPHA
MGQRSDFLLFFSFLLICGASCSFLYGQPCSDRNTAYLDTTRWSLPKNQTNCVDITGTTSISSIPQEDEFYSPVRDADTLYADHMNLHKFPIFLIYRLSRLELVDLSDNHIRRVPHKLHKIAPSLTRLLLPDNAIVVSSKRSLFKSDSVKLLMLSRNFIKNIYPITFSKLPNLEILYLDGNYIKHFTSNVFRSLSRLLYLNLENNVLEEVPPKEMLSSELRIYIVNNQKKVIK